MKPEHSATMIRHAIGMFQKQNPVHLKIIKLIIYEDHLLPYYKHLIIDDKFLPKRSAPKPPHILNKHSTPASVLQQPAFVEMPQKSMEQVPEHNFMLLRICSNNQNTNHQVSESIVFDFGNFSFVPKMEDIKKLVFCFFR